MHAYSQSRAFITVINLQYDIGKTEVGFIRYLFCHENA